jgi:membrane protein EpsK
LACALGEPLLRLWLGPAFGEWSPLLFLMAAHLCINMAINPLLGLQLTANRMKTPGVVTLVMGLGNLGLALLLAGPMQWGLYGIAAAGAIMLTLKNVCFTPLHAAHILGKPRFTFLSEILPIAGMTAGTVLLGRAVAGVWEIGGWGELMLAGFGLSIAYGAAVYGLVLNPAERRMVGAVLQTRGARP